MPKPVRLTSAEHRSWSHNIPQLVDKKGMPLVAVSPALEEACFKIIKTATNSQKSLKKKVVVAELQEDGSTSKRELMIEARVKRMGSNVNEIEVYCFVEGLLRANTRDIMRARFFKKHGECQLMRPNGKFMAVIRDPKRATVTVTGPGAAIRHAPEPMNCACKAWGNAHPGKHHPVCEHNMMAPEDERGIAPGDVSPGKANRPIPRGARLAVKTPEPKKPKPIPSPEECACKDWEKPDPKIHHGVCEHKKAWEMLAENRTQYFLVSMDTSQVVREASAQEAAEGDITEQKTGTRTLDINQSTYVLMTREEVDAFEESAVESETGEEGEHLEDSEDDGEAPQTQRGAEDERAAQLMQGADIKAIAAMSEEQEDDGGEGSILNMGEGAPEATVEEPADESPEDNRGAGLDGSDDGEGLVLPGMDHLPEDTGT